MALVLRILERESVKADVWEAGSFLDQGDAMGYPMGDARHAVEDREIRSIESKWRALGFKMGLYSSGVPVPGPRHQAVGCPAASLHPTRESHPRH